MYVNKVLSKEYGLNAALLLQNFAFWISINKKNNNNLKEGRVWTYQTLKSLKDKFECLSIDKIRYAIESLVKKGILLKSNFNKTKYDRTIWYAFQDDALLEEIISKYNSKQISQMDNGILPDRIQENPTPIPDIVTDNKKEIVTTTSEFENINNTNEKQETLNIEYIKTDLLSRRLGKNQVNKIVTSFSAEYILDKIEQYEYVLKFNPKSMKNKVRYLYMSIVDDWSDPLYEVKKIEKQREIKREIQSESNKNNEKVKLEYDKYIEGECKKHYEILTDENKKLIDYNIIQELNNSAFLKDNQMLFNMTLENKRVLFILEGIKNNVLSFEEFFKNQLINKLC